MKYYSFYMVSDYGRNMDSEENFVYCHYEDNVLVRANSPEEAMEKAEKWAISKRREVYRIDKPFAMPCRWFIGGWREKRKGWRWYEVHAFGEGKDGRHRKDVYGYIWAPNKKYVAERLREMGAPLISYISREIWNVLLK